MSDAERLLSSTEVAALFRVSARTVTAWANAGRLPSLRTPGGHHRFALHVVEAALRGEQPAGHGGIAREVSAAPDEVAIDLTQPQPDRAGIAFPGVAPVASQA